MGRWKIHYNVERRYLCCLCGSCLALVFTFLRHGQLYEFLVLQRQSEISCLFSTNEITLFTRLMVRQSVKAIIVIQKFAGESAFRPADRWLHRSSCCGRSILQ